MIVFLFFFSNVSKLFIIVVGFNTSGEINFFFSCPSRLLFNSLLVELILYYIFVYLWSTNLNMKRLSHCCSPIKESFLLQSYVTVNLYLRWTDEVPRQVLEEPRCWRLRWSCLFTSSLRCQIWRDRFTCLPLLPLTSWTFIVIALHHRVSHWETHIQEP